MSSVVEKFLLENRNLPDLFLLLQEPRLTFCYKDILEKIEDQLESGTTVSPDEKIEYTKKILELSEDVLLCHRIVKLMWKGKGPPAKKRKEEKADEVIQEVKVEIPDERNDTSIQDISEERDDNVEIWDVYEEDTQMSSSSSIQIQENPSPDRNSIADDDLEDNIEEPSDNRNPAKSQLVEILGKEKKKNEKFNLTQLEIEFKINEPKYSEQQAVGFQWLFDAFQELIDIIAKDTGSGDKAVLGFYLPGRPEVKPIRIGLTPVHEITPKLLLDKIEKSSTNYCPISICDTMNITANIAHATAGNGRNYVNNMTLDQIRRFKRRSAIDLGVQKDCLPIALLFGQALLIKDEKRRKSKMLQLRRSTAKLQEEVAKMTKTVTMNKPSLDGTYDLSFIRAYAEKFKCYRVIVYDNLKDHSSIRYSSPRSPINFFNVISIFYDSEEKHFFTISNVKAFFSVNHYCEMCDVMYNHNNHKCKDRCMHCKQVPSCPLVSKAKKLHCSDCNGDFMGITCYNIHKVSGVCAKMCEMAETSTIGVEAVEASPGQVKCFNCNKFVDIPHHCYLQRYKYVAPKSFTIVFYAIEWKFIEIDNGFGRYLPNICVTNTVCHLCYNASSFPSNCTHCNPAECLFENTSSNCLVNFIDYLTTTDNEWPIYAIAYNAKPRDMQFIVEELCENGFLIQPTIVRGKLCISVNGVTFIDSTWFIPMSMQQVSVVNNETFVVLHPPAECSTANSESLLEDHYKLFLWYNTVKEETFSSKEKENSKKNLRILREVCLRFMNQFLEITTINPFQEASSLSDAAMKVYCKNYMKDNTLTVSLENNYALKCKPQKSKIALKWLTHIKDTSYPDLHYGYKLPNSDIVVDGFDEESNSVFDFMGCYYHGDTCLLNREMKDSEEIETTLHERYEMMRSRMKTIVTMGYRLFITWECEFLNYLKEEIEVNEMLKKHPEVTQGLFDLAAANYGARNEVFKMYYRAHHGDRIFHLRFNSLYTWVNKYTKYFVGHPTIIRKLNQPEDILNFDGVARCRVLPPRGLYLPCLPYVFDHKLIFPLCAQCVTSTSITSKCAHSDQERSLVGHWCIDEIRLAVSHGYKILECYEIWSYDCVQYDRATEENGLFAEYVDAFLKIKQEASGWPKECTSNEAKTKYCHDYAEKEGIHLNKSNIITMDSGLRSLAQTMLNGLWEVFAEKDNLEITICTTPNDLNQYLTNPQIAIENLYPCGGHQVITTWCHSAENTPSNYLEVDICTRSNARIVMYNVISSLGRNVLYCDSDSVIFVVPNGEENPLSTGMFLHWTVDVVASHGEGVYIDEFVATAPKTYAIGILNPSTGSHTYEVNYKGISMNHRSEEKLNFDSLKALVDGSSSVKVEYPDKRSNPSTSASEHSEFTFDQGRCVAEYDILPFGY